MREQSAARDALRDLRACGAHEADHVQGPNGGHEPVPHGHHIDYLLDGHLHHPHADHCDDHGPFTPV